MSGRADAQNNIGSEYSTNTAVGSNMRSTEPFLNSDTDTDFNFEQAHSSNTAGGSNWKDTRPSNSDSDFSYERKQSSKTAGGSSMRGTGPSFKFNNNVNFKHAQTPNAATDSQMQGPEPSIDPDEDANLQNTDGDYHSQSFDPAFNADTDVGSDHARLSNSQSNGQGIDPVFDTHSMETIDQDPFTDTNEKIEGDL